MVTPMAAQHPDGAVDCAWTVSYAQQVQQPLMTTSAATAVKEASSAGYLDALTLMMH